MSRHFNLRSLLAAGLLVLGIAAQPAAAATILVDPNPTDFFNIGNSFSMMQPINDSYQFTLTKAATIDGQFNQFRVNVDFTLLDDNNVNIGFSSTLQAGTLYVLRATGLASRDFIGPYVYTGHLAFTAVSAVPIPPAILLFASALGGLGFVGFRRRNSTPLQ